MTRNEEKVGIAQNIFKIVKFFSRKTENKKKGNQFVEIWRSVIDMRMNKN